MDNEDNLIRARPIKSGQAIKRVPVIILSSILFLTVVYGIARGFEPRTKKITESDKREALPSEDVKKLPNSYSDIEKLPLPKPTQIKVVSKTREKSDWEKALEKAREESLKRRMEAQVSDLGFSNIDIQGKDKARSIESSEAAARSDSVANSPRDDVNRQDDKFNFLTKPKTESVVLTERTQQPASPYLLSAGTIIPGILISGINSDLPGQIVGQVSQNVYDSASGNYLLVPQWTKIIGQYDSRIVYGQERVLVVWTRIIFPDTSSICLEGMPGVDMSGYAGLTDQVNNHYGKLFTGVILTSLLGAGAQMADGSTYQTQNPSYGQLATQGVAQNANEVGQELTKKNLNVQPTLEIRPGYRFNVFVTKDLILEPK